MSDMSTTDAMSNLSVIQRVGGEPHNGIVSKTAIRVHSLINLGAVAAHGLRT